MHDFFQGAFARPPLAWAGHGLPRKGPGEEADEDEEGLELPVNPDQGTPLVPDEEGDVTVPA
jgi:hypothetical protein